MFFNEQHATTFTNSNFFNASINENSEIFRVDMWSSSPPQKVGVTIEKYNELLNVANKFQEKLEELGVLEKEKTPEEIQKENNNLLNMLNNKLESFSERLEALEKFNFEKLNNSECSQNEEIERIEENEQHNNKKDNERNNKQIKYKSK